MHKRTQKLYIKRSLQFYNLPYSTGQYKGRGRHEKDWVQACSVYECVGSELIKSVSHNSFQWTNWQAWRPHVHDWKKSIVVNTSEL